MTAVVVVAHGSGIDDIAVMAGPMLIFGILLAVARRRADRLESPPGAQDDDTAT